MTHHDLVIIGSGSGNSLVTPDFEGRSVAIIESNPTFGGTCLNVGCIPTKMLVRAGEAALAVEDGARLGVDATLDRVRWPDIRDRVFGRIDPISAGGKAYRRDGDHTTLYEGRARFIGERTLMVTGQDGTQIEVSGDQIVIATGSHPTLPEPLAGAAAAGLPVHTSDTVMRLDALPASMLIVGGGYIAAEFAHVFGSLGVRVTIVNRSHTMLRAQDDDIRAVFTQYAERAWDVRPYTRVTALEPTGEQTANGPRIRATLSSGTVGDSAVAGRTEDEIAHLDVDIVLVATGREPSSADLAAAIGGVDVDEDGYVLVDAHGRTSAPGVWALGDVCTPVQLKHVANQQARVVAHNLVHPEDLRSFAVTNIPSAVFTHPEIASVGLTEAQAHETGRDLAIKVQKYGDTAYGWALEDTTGLVKLIADRATGRLLGAHIIGPTASSLIQTLIHAMEFDQHVHDVARGQYWIHPALAEVVENALLGLDVTAGTRLDPR